VMPRGGGVGLGLGLVDVAVRWTFAITSSINVDGNTIVRLRASLLVV